MIRPEQMQTPAPIDLKLGIKSSLPNVKKALSLLILLWESNDRPSSLAYCTEEAGKLRPDTEAYDKFLGYIAPQLANTELVEEDLLDAFNSNPLLTSQIEALIVALELIWKLAKVTFTKKLAFSAERVGGKRFAKELHFTSNMDIIDTVMSQNMDAFKTVLLSWFIGKANIRHDVYFEQILTKLLTAFSEDAIYKMSSGEFDITFQNHGIYRQLSNGSAQVDVTGEEEAKGSLRILKSALSDELNFYLAYKKGTVTRHPSIDAATLELYTKRVETYLSLGNYNVTVSKGPAIAPVSAVSNMPISKPHNRIVFGAPGTGKSHLLETDRIAFGDNFERVTFHPNCSYAQFVGTYKPIPAKGTNGEETITYAYVPGPFMRVLAKAMEAKKSGSNTPQLLIIEEINRSNVAAVFGDIFQLLDRKNGVSEYPIQTSEDIRKYLSVKFGETEDQFESLQLPDNMYIWATMNSADQGVFPMDTAFKRRWNFEYLSINHGREAILGKFVELNAGHTVAWDTFREAINKKLISLRVNEDKLLGPFFLGLSTLSDKVAFNESFKSKVLMYLFEDAARQHRSELFRGCDASTYSSVCEAFDEKGEAIFGFPSLAVDTANP